MSSYTSSPIFTLNDMAIDKNGLLGGYFYVASSIHDIVIKTVRSVLKGTSGGSIVSPDYARPVFDYQVLEKKGISPYNCPPDTFFYLRPSTFWEQYRLHISMDILLLFFIIFCLRWRIETLGRQRNLQRRELELMRNYRALNCKLSLALDIANIIPWRWDLRAHLIFCDVQHSNSDRSISKKSLEISEEKYFSKIRKSDRDRMKDVCEALIRGDVNKIKEEFQATSRNMPFDQTPVGDKCVCCGKKAKHKIYWGKAY